MQNNSDWLSRISVFLIALFGVCTGLVVIGTVIYDLLAKKYGWITVSAETRALGRSMPILAVLIAAHLAFQIGLLLGHLFLCPSLDKSPGKDATATEVGKPEGATFK